MSLAAMVLSTLPVTAKTPTPNDALPVRMTVTASVENGKIASTKTLEDATREHVLQTLEDTKWVVGGRHGAAARLGIARTTLIAKMRRLGLEARDGSRRGANHHQAAFGALA